MGDRVVAVYGSSRARPGDGLYEEGVELGRLLAEAGFGVTNGGYSGLMEAVSKGAASVGGRVVGVTAPTLFPHRPGGNGFLTEEIQAAGLLDRIRTMSELASAFIVMPGSIGTLTELMIAWNDAYLAAGRGAVPMPILAFGDAWSEIVDRLTRDIRTKDGLVTMVDNAAEAMRELRNRLGDGAP